MTASFSRRSDQECYPTATQLQLSEENNELLENEKARQLRRVLCFLMVGHEGLEPSTL